MFLSLAEYKKEELVCQSNSIFNSTGLAWFLIDLKN
jgi:hypothetical protein